MFKINYDFTALAPIFTGADENFGTEKKLRREKVVLKNPIVIESKFKNTTERDKAIVNILKALWYSIDKENFQKSRLMTIWDEFTSKLYNATTVPSVRIFLTKFCNSWGIPSIKDSSIIQDLQKFNNFEFLTTLRENIQYYILLLREIIKNKDSNLLEDSNNNNEIEKMVLQYEYIPFISGNSIRGMLRRLAMYDYTKLVEISKINQKLYHMFFTGGFLDSGSSYEDIDLREQFIEINPMIGLFGTAIGNQTIEGELKIGSARPKCKEHGNGELSFWELLGQAFGTRLDSEKTEKNIIIVPYKDDKGTTHVTPTTQMIYQYEVFVKGTEFTHNFVCTTDNELLLSAFARVLKLFKENNYIGGISSHDNGEIDLSNLIVDNITDEIYLEYISKNKEKIREYLNGNQ